MTSPLEIGRTLGATALVMVLGLGLLWQLTDGLTVFTSETWRRTQIQKNPRPLPAMALQDEHGQVFELRSLCGQVLVLDFVYTRCPGVCQSLGAASSQLAKRLTEAGQAVTVMSMSFDPVHDQVAQLAAFKKNLEPQSTRWRVARPMHTADRDQLLATAGVVVIDDGRGGYEHNAAWHLVDKQCRITRLLNVEDVDHAERTAIALL